ncbi:MAG: ABC transporter permease, partial [Cellulosimicrobium funkei]
MGRYVLRRAGQGLFVLWAAFTISFFVLYLLPSDPAALM